MSKENQTVHTDYEVKKVSDIQNNPTRQAKKVKRTYKYKASELERPKTRGKQIDFKKDSRKKIKQSYAQLIVFQPFSSFSNLNLLEANLTWNLPKSINSTFLILIIKNDYSRSSCNLMNAS